jgi:hypothetical protein
VTALVYYAAGETTTLTTSCRLPTAADVTARCSRDEKGGEVLNLTLR